MVWGGAAATAPRRNNPTVLVLQRGAAQSYRMDDSQKSPEPQSTSVVQVAPEYVILRLLCVFMCLSEKRFCASSLDGLDGAGAAAPIPTSSRN